MKYKVINEELRIYSCSIADLTLEQVNHFLGQWNDGANIGELTLFYEKEKDRIVMNRDNGRFKDILEMVEGYICLPDAEREKVREASAGKSVKETLDVLENAVTNRRNALELKILGNQVADHDYGLSYSMAHAIKERYGKKDGYFALLMAFSYGFMQGKRADRARRKRGAAGC